MRYLACAEVARCNVRDMWQGDVWDGEVLACWRRSTCLPGKERNTLRDLEPTAHTLADMNAEQEDDKFRVQSRRRESSTQSNGTQPYLGIWIFAGYSILLGELLYS